jgi:hypothetical protein
MRQCSSICEWQEEQKQMLRGAQHDRSLVVILNEVKDLF